VAVTCLLPKLRVGSGVRTQSPAPNPRLGFLSARGKGGAAWALGGRGSLQTEKKKERTHGGGKRGERRFHSDQGDEPLLLRNQTGKETERGAEKGEPS